MIWVYLISFIFLLLNLFLFKHWVNRKNGKVVLKRWLIILEVILICIPIANIIGLFVLTIAAALWNLEDEYYWTPIKNDKWNKFINWLNKEI